MKFVFKAKKSSGEIYEGEKDIADRYALYKILQENGEEVISVSEKHKSLKINIQLPSIFKKVKTVEKINFARNLGAMLEAGLALSRALSVIERQSNNKFFKEVISKINADIDGGTNFAEALGKYPKIFPEIFIAMVHAGEQSGTLTQSLKVIATQMENSHNLERKVRGALVYPTVILFVMVLIAILMFIFVVPTLMKTFTELNVQLPLTTRIVLGISTVIQHYGIIVIIVLGGIFAGIYSWAKRYSGKKFFHMLMLKTPILGPLVQEVNSARTARTLASLLGAGVEVVESVNITAQVVQNVYFKKVLQNAAETIGKGELMSKVFASASKYYPVFVSEMVSIGEETGNLKDMMSGVAKYYEDDVDDKTKNMSTIIEPVLMVVIAAAVGFFAVSMISPMYSLVNAI